LERLPLRGGFLGFDFLGFFVRAAFVVNLAMCATLLSGVGDNAFYLIEPGCRESCLRAAQGGRPTPQTL
jgi:hypothetical protein